jgi:hypothetical protein
LVAVGIETPPEVFAEFSVVGQDSSGVMDPAGRLPFPKKVEKTPSMFLDFVMGICHYSNICSIGRRSGFSQIGNR